MLWRCKKPKGLVILGLEAVSVIFGEIRVVGFFFGWVGLVERGCWCCWEGAACFRWEVRTPAENLPKEEEAAVLKRFRTKGFEGSEDIFFY